MFYLRRNKRVQSRKIKQCPKDKLRFILGTTVVTAAADKEIKRIAGKRNKNGGAIEFYQKRNSIRSLLMTKHLNLERGELNDIDYQLNLAACKDEGKKDGDGNWMQSRIFSSFKIENIKFWIITESDRKSTTILLPEEY